MDKLSKLRFGLAVIDLC